MPSIWQSFVTGGFSGQIQTDFLLIILAMLAFTFVNSKFALRLWTNSKGKKVDFQKIVNYAGIIFPAAFVFYALFGLDFGIPCFTIGIRSVCLFDYKGGALLFHSFNYAVLARVLSVPNSGHIICWLGILTTYYSIMYMERKSQYFAGKALISGLGLIAVSEFFWNMFYLVYLLFVTHTFELVTLGGFVISQLWLVTVILIWFFYYRKFLLKMLPIILPVEAIYFGVWFAEGFHITLTANVTTNPDIITQWYFNLGVNETEIGSWLCISFITIFAYWFVKNHVWTKIENSIAVYAEQKLREAVR